MRAVIVVAGATLLLPSSFRPSDADAQQRTEAQALGGNPTTGAEENLLGYPGTRYYGEHMDVFHGKRIRPVRCPAG
jgi:hypothetical protein